MSKISRLFKSNLHLFFVQGFFRQITSPNVIASQVKLTELFQILLKVDFKQSDFVLSIVDINRLVAELFR